MKQTALDDSWLTVVHSCDREGEEGKERLRNKKILHTDAVKRELAQRPIHPLINQPAPEIHKDEDHLPRESRRRLAQLRAGKCPLLKAYLHNIGAAEHPSCPLCENEQHTTQHLFECRAVPTTLTPQDLWRRPAEAADLVSRWATLLDEAEAAEEA